MTMLPVIVVGAGGHGRVVADALIASGVAVAGFTDPDPALAGRTVMGRPVLGDDAALADLDRGGHLLANGIGSTGASGAPRLRRMVGERLLAEGWRFAEVRHPTAMVAASARLEGGVQLLAGSIVQPQALIGEAAIINTAAVVEHDCVVGAYSHVSIGAVLCGEVRIGSDCHIGAGAVVIQGISLGAGTIVGAGAAVVRDHRGPGPLLGVPARSGRMRR